MAENLRVVILGLSITSSWGNGHATNYRALARELARRDHDVLFLERDAPWYESHRDRIELSGVRVELYGSLTELRERFEREIHDADVVIVGSYVPEGIAVGEWVVGLTRGVSIFYDIDTPVTLAAIDRGECSYLSRELIRRYHLYLSFTGGPTLDCLARVHGAPRPRAFYCFVDGEQHFPRASDVRWQIGYLGTYSADRQPSLDRLLLEPARRRPDAAFAVAGPSYPHGIDWPANVQRIDHISPDDHRGFYCSQRFTLSVTRTDMLRAGYSPSVRLFEAAACATPVISDWWEGLDTIFAPGREILVAATPEETLAYMSHMREEERSAVGERARRRVLIEHTVGHRVDSLERELEALLIPAPSMMSRR